MSITSAMVEAGILGLAKIPVVISGSLGAGNVLTASLRPGYSATGFQWTRNGSDISGQTASTYTQLTTDRGSVIGCRATGLAYSGSAGTVPVVAPGAPTGVSVSAGNGSVTGAFSAPADNGGSAITGYQMPVYRASDNLLLGTATGAASPLTLSGLPNGVPVYIKVAAVSAVGVGAQSAPSASVSPTPNTNKIGTLKMRSNDSYVTGASGLRTSHGKFEVEADFEAVRVVYMNKYGSGTMPNIEALVGVTDTMALNTVANCFYPTANGVAYNSMATGGGMGWSRVTFGGANIGVPAVNSGGSNGCTYLVSDWIPLNSIPRTDVVGGRPGIVVRLANSLAGAGIIITNGSLSSTYNTKRGQPYYREWVTSDVNNDGVNTLTNAPPVSTSAGWEMAYFLEFKFKNPVRNVHITGDSRKSAAYNSSGTSWEIVGLRGLSTPASPICISNFAGSGHSQQQFLKLLTDYWTAGGNYPTDASIPAFSQNGFTDQSTYASAQSAVLATIAAQKIKLFQDSDYAVNGYAGAKETERQKCITAAKTLAASGASTYVDIDTVISDYSVSPPIMKAIYDDQGSGPGTGDHIHANQAGQDQMMAVLQAAWS
ncbi:fibronectin type III domain-containing protein [Herbaspirillum huttiense]|uniref:fibronectin type III domain-containing protein n=1 Tax=Herbaspirillum huttiense TaxID=863372 RepID=UPI001065FB4B|nr:fibronectin type III domain-containing protein [Herbaspirillum huttiense]QBP75393.1 fibronectin type III domain-containing protein [Herbaspirillum huttiense]